MKFVLFFAFIFCAGLAIVSPQVRKGVDAALRKVWKPLLLAAAIAIAFWFAAYGGDSIRLF